MEEIISLLRKTVSDTEGEVSSPLIKATMKQVVPTFRDPEEINKEAESCDEMKMAANV